MQVIGVSIGFLYINLILMDMLWGRKYVIDTNVGGGGWVGKGRVIEEKWGLL